MTLLLDDVGTQLDTDLVTGGATGWTLFKSYLPPSPDQIVSIYETSGEFPDVNFTFPGLQIFVRAGEFEYVLARNKMDGVISSLDNATVSGYSYIFATTSPQLLRVDNQENRILIVLNFKVMKNN